ncbi:MAG: zinc ribbon domain-containing protein [Alistipes sp.]|nr:zinc ribbon domain-containing protein [Alistipes sp.]
MAFVNCHKCNTRISDIQDECPHCGHPLHTNTIQASRPSSIGYGLFYIVMSFVLGAAAYNYKDSTDIITAFLREVEPFVGLDNRVTGFMVLSYGVMALTAICFISGLVSIIKSAKAAHIIVFLSMATFVCMALFINDGNFFEINDERFVPHSTIRATICLHLALWPTLAIATLNAIMTALTRNNK